MFVQLYAEKNGGGSECKLFSYFHIKQTLKYIASSTKRSKTMGTEKYPV